MGLKSMHFTEISVPVIMIQLEYPISRHSVSFLSVLLIEVSNKTVSSEYSNFIIGINFILINA